MSRWNQNAVLSRRKFEDENQNQKWFCMCVRVWCLGVEGHAEALGEELQGVKKRGF